MTPIAVLRPVSWSRSAPFVAIGLIIATLTIRSRDQERTARLVSLKSAVDSAVSFDKSIAAQVDEIEKHSHVYYAEKAKASGAGQKRHDTDDEASQRIQAKIELAAVDKLQPASTAEMVAARDLCDDFDARYGGDGSRQYRRDIDALESARDDEARAWWRAIEDITDSFNAADKGEYADVSGVRKYYDDAAAAGDRADVLVHTVDHDIDNMQQRADGDVAARKGALATATQ